MTSMNLYQRLQHDMKEAMRAKDQKESAKPSETGL
jgi:uncharacterized protein YqeY